VLFCTCTSTRLLPSLATWLTWDLTVHQLHHAFSRCMAAQSTDLLDAGAAQESAQTRLAAARHAVDDIQAAPESHGRRHLRQMPAVRLQDHR